MPFALEDPQKLRNPTEKKSEEVFYIKDDLVDLIGDVENHFELEIMYGNIKQEMSVKR